MAIHNVRATMPRIYCFRFSARSNGTQIDQWRTTYRRSKLIYTRAFRFSGCPLFCVGELSRRRIDGGGVELLPTCVQYTKCPSSKERTATVFRKCVLLCAGSLAAWIFHKIFSHTCACLYPTNGIRTYFRGPTKNGKIYKWPEVLRL